MKRVKATPWRGLICPANPDHGNVFALSMPDGSTVWHCPHNDHSGRPKSHPAGAAPYTRSSFTLNEVESGVLAGAAA